MGLAALSPSERMSHVHICYQPKICMYLYVNIHIYIYVNKNKYIYISNCQTSTTVHYYDYIYMLHTCTYLYTCFPYMLPLHHNQPPTMLFLCFSMCCSTHDSWLPFFLRFSLVAWQHLVSCQGTPVMDGSKLLNWKHSILEGVFLPEDTLNPPIERFGFVQQGSGISNEIPWFLVLESFFSHSIHVCFCLTYINPTRINYSVM